MRQLGVFTKPHKPHQNRSQNGIIASHRIASNSAPHRTTPHGAVRFDNKKTTQTTPHHTLSIY